ncbi:MAG TPA: ferritin-like domain-containing protein [Verrucomicrobiae bacterium]|nr:ferritin-like domain-containing protein [Verrucomicrobiae bacterium]
MKANLMDGTVLRAGMMGRRRFLRALGVTGAAVATGMRFDQTALADAGTSHKKIDRGDADILRFLAAAELIETDFWQQYNELVAGNAPYGAALANLDEDMAVYVADNTDDENTHAEFLNAYLVSQGAEPVNLDVFRTLPSSPATGAAQIGRLTNLTMLTVDTSFWIRYRSTGNPDFGDTFPQFIDIVDRTAIPLRDDYTADEIQAIANTAAFHFPSIEQGGSSLYTTMLTKATALDTVRIIAGIGGVEVAHFTVWHDKAGNAPPVSVDGLVFPDMETFNGDELRQNNLIMPEPCKFISADLPECSVIRPGTAAHSGAVAAATALTNSGLFTGQSPAFFAALRQLAQAADAAARHGP